MRAGRLPARTGDLRADAIRQLRWAMSGAGLTADKAPLMTAVLELPAVAAALRGVPATAAPAVAVEVLVAAARGLGDGLHARMLRNSLGVDYRGDAKDLTARRVEFVTAHNDAARAAGSKNLLGETTRASYDVEQEMLGALVTALGAPPGIPGPAAAAGAEPAWMTVDEDVTFRLEGRAGREAEIVHVIRALVGGLSEFTVSYFCSDSGDGRGTAFRLYEGGTVEEDRSVGRRDFRTVRIRFPAPLRAGDTHRLRYNATYSGGPSPDPYWTLLIVRPTERATIRVAFDREALPARVWRVDGLIPGSEGGNPDEAEPLATDSTGVVCATFDTLRAGFAYGVAWAWPE